MQKISDETKAIFRDAAQRMSGFKKRQYQAEIVLKYFGGSTRKTERGMGRGRKSVEKGLKELETGIRCPDNFFQVIIFKTEYTKDRKDAIKKIYLNLPSGDRSLSL